MMTIRNCISKILLLIFAVTAFALDSFAETGDSKSVRIGFFESTGMFEGAQDGAEKGGYCYDYMMQIATYTGWNYEFCYGSFADLYEKLKNGEIDILPYTNFNEQRSREVLFSEEPLAIEEYYLAVKKGTQVTKGIPSIDGGVISTMRNADYNSLLNDFIRENNLNVKISYYNFVDEIWDAMRNGKADATIYTSISFSKDGWDCNCPFGRKPTYICVAKERPDLLSQLNDAIDLIGKESPGYKESLFSKYFSDNPIRKILTDEEQNWINGHPVIHIGCLSNDEPDIFTYDDATHTATGLTVDIVNGIIERLELGSTADFRCYESLSEMEAALDAGEIDAVFPFYQNHSIADRHNFYTSNTVRVSNMALIYKIGTSYSDAQKKIAASSTRLGAYYVHDIFPESEIVNSTTIKDAVEKVREGDATGAIAQSHVMQRTITSYNNLNYIILTQGCAVCFATRPENYPLLRVINRGLIFFSDSEITGLSSKYTHEPKVTFKAFIATHKSIGIMAVIILLSLIALAINLISVNKLKKKADVANNSKTTFLFNISHDIRTPMNAILGYTDIAIRHIDDKEKTVDSLNKIKSAGGHLYDLINSILEMSRIEAGKLELTKDAMDIRTVISNTENMGKALALSKSIDFIVTVGKIANPYVFSDELHLNEVLINVISNAMKYSNDGSIVRYDISQTAEPVNGKAQYRFVIADKGIGMSREFLEHIYESFSRERSASVSKLEGAGLGMSIVKRIIDHAGGTIDIQSAPGEGTTVTIDLPLQVMDKESIDALERGESSTSDEVKYYTALRGKRVLLVEDNQMNSEIAEAILLENGMIVETAEDGEIAVNKFRENDPDYYDFILMDIQMPVMNGYEATRAIRKIPGGDAVPIIAVSANAFEEDRRKSLEAGMDDHIAKPINIQELFDAMKILI